MLRRSKDVDVEDVEVGKEEDILKKSFHARQHVVIFVYVLVCEQYIRERGTGNCAGTELVRYR